VEVRVRVSVSPEHAEPARVADLVRRLSEEPDPAWLAEHHKEVLGLILACDRDGLRELGARLAHVVWPVAGSVADPDWWRELAGAGEALAIAGRDPGMLVDLLDRSARVFAAHGDRVGAEAQWVRALAITRRPPGGELRERGAAILGELGGLYREWGRLGKALDAYLGLVDLRRAAGAARETAEALATVAATMYAAGRPESAAGYFAEATRAMPEDTEDPLYARILVWWGRVLWEQGERGPARRRWSQALARVVDVDEDLAEHVRALLATEAGAALPGGYPITG
jgi:tetratricopeptide (TPR) repeat protein